MWKNHVKIAYRQIAKNKVFSVINILGLSLGMTLAILIAVFVKSEFSYDSWLPNSEMTYRVYRDWGADHSIFTPSGLTGKLVNEYPEVERATSFSAWGEQLITYNSQSFYVSETARVDSAFFEVIEMPFLKGNPQTAMDGLNNVVLTDRIAAKIFGTADPMGEIITYNGTDRYMVTGIVDTENKNSHFPTDVYVRRDPQDQTYWSGNDRYTYARLQPNVDQTALESNLTADITQLLVQELESFDYSYTKEDIPNWAFQPISRVYLQSSNVRTFGLREGNLRNLYIFLAIGGLVLLVAIINYINLTTARASQRGKEVGVKKVAGASRSSLARQFLVESVVEALFAGLVALVLAEVFLPFFNNVTNRELAVLTGEPIHVVLGTLLLAIITGMLAGLYPAVVLSGFRPIAALKSSFLKAGNNGLFRKVLVTGQFAVTITLLIVMGFIYRQVNYMLDQDLGFRGDQVVTIPLNSDETHRKIESLKTRLKAIPGVLEVTTSSDMPGHFFSDWAVIIEGQSDMTSPNVLFADEDYLPTLGLEMSAGRFLRKDIAADTLNNFVVNQEFVRRSGIEQPIGHRLKFAADTVYGKIVGVVKDFHFENLSKAIQPLVMTARHQRDYAGLKLSTENLPQTLTALEQFWTELEPNHPLRYSFLDADFAQEYAEQQRFGKTVLYATLLTLFIALLGLFGLTTFTVERRSREIGIRKVLGASVANLVGLLTQDFMKLVLLATFIAVPAGYLLSDRWLNDFAHRTNLVWWIFVGAGLIILIVGFLTVSFQSVKAAVANPVRSIKSE